MADRRSPRGTYRREPSVLPRHPREFSEVKKKWRWRKYAGTSQSTFSLANTACQIFFCQEIRGRGSPSKRRRAISRCCRNLMHYLSVNEMWVHRDSGIARLQNESNNLFLYSKNLSNFMLHTTTPGGVAAYARRKHVSFAIIPYHPTESCS